MKNKNEIKKSIDSYWINKGNRRISAQKHNTLMLTLWKDEINDSIKNSKIYGDVNEICDIESPKQVFKNVDSVTALFDNYDENKKICILNFASYKYPGGGYMGGSSAQEESLCHESTLYEVISNEKFKHYYDWNNQNLNKSLYLNRAIYSPNIIFSRDKNLVVDVLTCAAPNIGSAMRHDVSDEENYDILKDRMQFIANILNDNKVNIFIGGAFGCGVFGQLPEDVASIWKELTYGKDLELIIHSVPGNDKNVQIFKESFGG